jgi:hypothetical protein
MRVADTSINVDLGLLLPSFSLVFEAGLNNWDMSGVHT